MSTAARRKSAIKFHNRGEFNELTSILTPEVLHRSVPRLGDNQAARLELLNLKKQMAAFSDFAPGTQFQHVANIDTSVWSAILEVFAKFDEVTGEPMHDGLLYITDSESGRVRLNKPFFYTLIEMLESCGYLCDMRTRKVL